MPLRIRHWIDDGNRGPRVALWRAGDIYPHLIRIRRLVSDCDDSLISRRMKFGPCRFQLATLQKSEDASACFFSDEHWNFASLSLGQRLWKAGVHFGLFG